MAAARRRGRAPWNLLGCIAFAGDLLLTPADIAKMDAMQRSMYEARPMWSIVGTGLAVVAGALGSLGLVMRRWAPPLLMASLLGVLLQDAGMLLTARASPGPVVLGLQGLVLAIALAPVALAVCARRHGWLR